MRRRGELHDFGLAFDSKTLDEAEQGAVFAFAAERGIEPITVERFIEEVFFPVTYELAGYCIGFNLPFDLSRLAVGHALARNMFKGGYSFRLSPDSRRPRVRVKHLTARAALIDFTAPAGRSPEQQARERGGQIDHHRGHFCDVKSLGGALTGQAHSLASLARLLDTEHQKLETDEHGGPLTHEYLDYALTDVQTTWECFAEQRPRYRSYGLTRTPLTKVKSEASIGKASLEEMGVKRWRELQPDFPPDVLGIVMSTYFGGRAAVRLRRMVTRVLYCDFLSQSDRLRAPGSLGLRARGAHRIRRRD